MGRFAGGQVCGLEGPRGVPGRARAAGSSARAGARQAGAAASRRLTRALLARQSMCYHRVVFVCVIAGGFGGANWGKLYQFCKCLVKFVFFGLFFGHLYSGTPLGVPLASVGLWGRRLLAVWTPPGGWWLLHRLWAVRWWRPFWGAASVPLVFVLLSALMFGRFCAWA